jgi:hypothetical protein
MIFPRYLATAYQKTSHHQLAEETRIAKPLKMSLGFSTTNSYQDPTYWGFYQTPYQFRHVAGVTVGTMTVGTTVDTFSAVILD